MLKLSFTIEALGGAAPRTKKNSSRQFKAVSKAGKAFMRIMPSKAHEVWFKAALPVANQMAGLIRASRPGVLPINFDINVAAAFYRDALTGDAVGHYQALADLLQAAEIVVDDKYIVSWDGSRLYKDKRRPRIEVVITLADSLPGFQPRLESQ